MGILRTYIERINKYPQLLVDYTLLKDKHDDCEIVEDSMLNNITVLKSELLKREFEITDLKKKLDDTTYVVTCDDWVYWDSKWKQNNIWYNAPDNKRVIEYVSYRDIQEIKSLAGTLINVNGNSFDNPDVVVSVYMNYQKKQFDDKKWKYMLDPSNKDLWRTPEETLKLGYGDCDDWMILGYYIMREMFKQLGLWEKVKHRLKCMDGHVFGGGDILVYQGRHAYLSWLHTDTNWYTVETTYYREHSINNFGKLPQKLNDWYGPIDYTFTEYTSWAQRSMTVFGKDYQR
jgi:hypothetical protein